MSGNTPENVESTHDDLRKYKNNQRSKLGSKKPRPRFSNDNKEDSTDTNKNPSGLDGNYEEGMEKDQKRPFGKPFNYEESMEKDQKRPFGKPFVDRIEDKISQMSYAGTTDLPPLDLSEKKFTGRNRIYIANIGNEINEEDLETLFKSYGETAEIFINNDKHFAFIKMDYHINALKAQRELDGITLKSRTLKMKISPSCSIVKVKNLTSSVTNELLYYAFSVFGEIENAVVLVDEKGKSTGEGIIDFARKHFAMLAIQKCREKCYFLTYSLKPVVVEHYDMVDQTVGLLDKHFNMRNVDFNQERSAGPRLADLGSFDHDYGTRWKSLYDLYRQKQEALRIEFRIDCEKLEAQMEYARYEYETESLREQLRARELDKERQKREWEAKERQAEEERIRAEAQIRQAQEEIQTRLSRQQEAMRRRQEEEANLLMQAQNLSSILDTHEILDYDVPTSSTREMFNNNSQNNMLGSRPGSVNFEQSWTRTSGMEGHWVREDVRDRGYAPKKRRF